MAQNMPKLLDTQDVFNCKITWQQKC